MAKRHPQGIQRVALLLAAAMISELVSLSADNSHHALATASIWASIALLVAAAAVLATQTLGRRHATRRP
jgi:hypothetical protein